MAPHCAMHGCLWEQVHCSIVLIVLQSPTHSSLSSLSARLTSCTSGHSPGLAQSLALVGTLWTFVDWLAKYMQSHVYHVCTPMTLKFSSPCATGFCFHFPILWEERRTWSRAQSVGVRLGNGAQGQPGGSGGRWWVGRRKRYPFHLFTSNHWLADESNSPLKNWKSTHSSCFEKKLLFSACIIKCPWRCCVFLVSKHMNSCWLFSRSHRYPSNGYTAQVLNSLCHLPFANVMFLHIPSPLVSKQTIFSKQQQIFIVSHPK